MKTTEVLTNFFANIPHNCTRISDWYNSNMEVQINVAPCGGEMEKMGVYSDDVQPYKWYNVRIPKNANSDPIDNDSNLAYPLDQYVDAIGMTGWDWKNKKSIRFGFDYDSIVGHAAGVGVSDSDLELVKEKAFGIPEVLILKSTGGAGLHLYLECDPDDLPDTATHTEHAALALAALKDLSMRVGFDFHSHLDVGGSNMWVWARKMTVDNQGLTVIKDNVTDGGHHAYYIPPENWKDYVDVVKGKRSRPRTQGVSDEDQGVIDEQAKSRKEVELDREHERLIADLHVVSPESTTAWLQDQQLLQTHTAALKKVFDEKEYKGVFDTLSQGNDPTKPNCFGYPREGGGWRFIRFGRGTNEAKPWSKSEDGWTYCYFNELMSLDTVSMFYQGTEDDKGGFVFASETQAMQAAKSLGTTIDIPVELQGRDIIFRKHRDGRLKVEVERRSRANEDLNIVGWIKKGKIWYKIFSNDKDEDQVLARTQVNIELLDKYVRAVVTNEYKDDDWAILHVDKVWMPNSKDNARTILATTPFSQEVSEALATALHNAWVKVNLPFQPEYPGGRRWNKDGAQLKYKPADLEPDEQPQHPHWDLILNHVGKDLDEYLPEDKWCYDNNILTGYDYLLCWITSMIKSPFQSLPYLFFHGEQGSGKSIFHEAINLLMTKGVVRADQALTSPSGFNGELAGAILCVVEEKNISEHPDAYNRLKEWVTATEFSIHSKFKQVVMRDNTTHWVHMANETSGCPIFPGDTRIVSINVSPFKKGTEIPTPDLLELLRKEAPHFMVTLNRFNVPESNGRLKLSVIATASKQQQAEANRNPLESFIDERCVYVPGKSVLFETFYEKFEEQLAQTDKGPWTKRRVTLTLPMTMPTGLVGSSNQRSIGNLMLKDDYDNLGELPETTTQKYVRVNRSLLLRDLTKEELYG